MTNVREPFSFQLNWFPEFSYCKIPDDYTGEIPEHWRILSQYVPPEIGLPTLRDVCIENVTSYVDASCRHTVPLAFSIDTDAKRPIENLLFRDIEITSRTFGSIASVKGLRFENVKISV